MKEFSMQQNVVGLDLCKDKYVVPTYFIEGLSNFSDLPCPSLQLGLESLE